MVDEAKAIQIVEAFKGLDIEAKLAALNQAKDMFRTIFEAEMSIAEYAKAAMRIEQLYNLIREELRVPQQRIKKDLGVDETKLPKSTKVSKPTKQKPSNDIGQLLKEFAAFKGVANASTSSTSMPNMPTNASNDKV